MHTHQIMIIDDDPEDQWIIRDTLEELNTGAIAVYASHGEQALAMLAEEYLGNRKPKVIVLDLNMPLMNGTATLGRLKADDRFKDIPVIIYSTSINPYEMDKCMELGAHSYITKPISIEETQAIVEKMLSFCE